MYQYYKIKNKLNVDKVTSLGLYNAESLRLSWKT